MCRKILLANAGRKTLPGDVVGIRAALEKKVIPQNHCYKYSLNSLGLGVAALLPYTDTTKPRSK